MKSRKKMDIMRRIQAAGYLPEIDSVLRDNLPNITIENNPMHSLAFDYLGAMGVILELKITSDREVLIQDFGDLELLGRPCGVNWWTNEKSYVYQFNGGPEYSRDVVLNHRVGAVVKPGRPMEGVLLGYSRIRIPSQYSHGLILPLILSIVDEFDNSHTAHLVVQVDESLRVKARQPNRGSLYAPRLNKKPDRFDGVETLVPRREQAETDLIWADATEPRAVGTLTVRDANPL